MRSHLAWIAVLLGLGLLLWVAVPAQPPKALFAPASGSPFTVGQQPADVAVGDVNGDTRPDILTANSGSHNVSVLLGDGRGGFVPAPGSPFHAGPRPHLIVLGDFTGDRRLDLAVTEHDSHDVRVFLGQGDGRFTRAPGSPFPALAGGAPHNHGLSVADVNGDGWLDLATSNQNDHSISVLLNDGKGGLRPAAGSPFRVGRAPYLHAIADLNGDTWPDVVAPNVVGGTISVLFGDGKGSFNEAPGSPYRVTPRPYFVAIGDVNGDGRPDILDSHDDASLISVLLNDGRGRFHPGPGSPVDIGQRGWKLVLGDVNRDRRLDLVTGALPGHVVVFLGDGQGGFRAAPGSPYAVEKDTWGVALADINRDARLDIVAASQASGKVIVLLKVENK